jgi:purine-nucleoside phosphorylase
MPIDAFTRVEEAAQFVRDWCGTPPAVAVVLGSGLGDVAARIAEPSVIDYREIPHWPRPMAEGHAGRLVVGTLAGRRIAALVGRAHLYEGYEPEAVVHPVRVLGRLGVRHLVLTNAAGALQASLAPGSLMVIDDHINMMGTSPLIGLNDERFGPRFPDMTEVYSARLRAIADEASRASGVPVSRGVYLAVRGPSYETPAEIRAFRAMGADAVGMSTVQEAIAARHMGLEVLGLSCLTNAAAGIEPGRLRHGDVLDAARRAGDRLGDLIEAIVRLMPVAQAPREQ